MVTQKRIACGGMSTCLNIITHTHTHTCSYINAHTWLCVDMRRFLLLEDYNVYICPFWLSLSILYSLISIVHFGQCVHLQEQAETRSLIRKGHFLVCQSDRTPNYWPKIKFERVSASWKPCLPAESKSVNARQHVFVVPKLQYLMNILLL